MNVCYQTLQQLILRKAEKIYAHIKTHKQLEKTCPSFHPLRLPEGLEDVSKVPNLVAELLRRGWSEEEVKAALGDNLLRVMKEVEMVRKTHTHTQKQDMVAVKASIRC